MSYLFRSRSITGVLVIIFLLAGCAPRTVTAIPIAATATAVNSPTPTLTFIPTSTFTPSPSPTIELSPTPTIPEFYRGLAPTLGKFSLVEKADIPSIIDYLRSQPSLLTQDSPAPPISQIVHSKSGEAHFSVSCNFGGIINCAPAASIQIAEQGLDVHIIIWEIRNSDGSRGHIVKYMYDSLQYNPIYGFERLVADPLGSYDMLIHAVVPTESQGSYPCTTFLLQQSGFPEAIQQWIDTRIIPEAFKDMILPW
jgi:hypothetical protein